jgi:methyl-accepting chemotaxis protein
MSSSIHDNTTGTITTVDPTTQTSIDTIRDVASNIREASARIKYLVRAVRENGAIGELATAVDEVVIVARDSTKEINEIAKALKDTAVQVEGTAVAACEISEAMRHTAQQINRSTSATKVISKKKS